MPDELQVGDWSKPLRRPVALATYVAAAMQTGIWSPGRLEAHIQKRNNSLLAPTRHLYRLRAGTPAYKPGVMDIQRALGGYAVAYWANHPVFHLLDMDEHGPLFDKTILFALNSISGATRHHLWPAMQTTGAPGSADMATALVPDASSLRKALKDRDAADGLPELDWLVLSLATYKQAQRARDADLAWEAAFITNAAFSRAVVLHPSLLVAWQTIAHVMADRVWGPAGLEGVHLSDVKVIPDTVRFLVARGVLSLPKEFLELAGLSVQAVSANKAQD